MEREAQALSAKSQPRQSHNAFLHRRCFSVVMSIIPLHFRSCMSSKELRVTYRAAACFLLILSLTVSQAERLSLSPWGELNGVAGSFLPSQPVIMPLSSLCLSHSSLLLSLRDSRLRLSSCPDSFSQLRIQRADQAGCRLHAERLQLFPGITVYQPQVLGSGAGATSPFLLRGPWSVFPQGTPEVPLAPRGETMSIHVLT